MKKEDKYIEKYGKMMADQLIIISEKSDPVQEAMKMIEILKGFEQEVRKDQDKITRHACAENVIIEGTRKNYYHDWMCSIERIIMNTKSV